MSMTSTKMLFEQYGWRFCETVMPTDKVSRKDENVAFPKLYKGALQTITCGWFIEAVLEWTIKTKKKYYIQCSSLKDMKHVTFIHTTCKGSSHGQHSVRRSKRGKRVCNILPAPVSHGDYIENFTAVNQHPFKETAIRRCPFGCWTMLSMFHLLLCVGWPKVELAWQNGSGTWRRMNVSSFRSIWVWVYSTTPLQRSRKI